MTEERERLTGCLPVEEQDALLPVHHRAVGRPPARPGRPVPPHRTSWVNEDVWSSTVLAPAAFRVAWLVARHAPPLAHL